MSRKFLWALMILLLCAIAFSASNDAETVKAEKLTDSHIQDLKAKFCTMGDLEDFYVAEFVFLQNHSDERVLDVLKDIAKSHDEPLVRQRASNLLGLIESDNFKELTKQDFYPLYFSSDFNRRIMAVEKLWVQSTAKASRYIFYFVENDKSYDVKIKAMQALADFKLAGDIFSFFVISAESTDEKLALSSIYVLLNNEPEVAAKTLQNWIKNPKFFWHTLKSWQIFETSPKLIGVEFLLDQLEKENSQKSLDSIWEILAQKIEFGKIVNIEHILTKLHEFIEKNKLKNTASWEKLWEIIAGKCDLSAFFKEVENKNVVPSIVWVLVAQKDMKYVMELAFSEDKLIRNNARLALARGGFGLELTKRIKVTEIKNNVHLTLSQLIQQIRRTCHFEIYLSSYTERIRDIEINAYFGNCSLYELLSMISKVMKLRFEFDNGRLLVFPEKISYRGFKLEPIFNETAKAKKFFSRYVVNEEIKTMNIGRFTKHLRDLTDFSIIVDNNVISKDYETPMIRKNRGVIPVLTRVFNLKGVDILIMANALWIMDKNEVEVYKNAANIIKDANQENFRKLMDSDNTNKYLILSSILKSDVAKQIKDDVYEKYVFEMLNSAKDDNDKATMISCLGRLVLQEHVLEKVIAFMQSTVYVVRNSATNTLKQAHPDAHMLLERFVNMNLTAQKVVLEIIAKELTIDAVVKYLVGQIETGNLKSVRLNFRTISRLIARIYRENAHPKTLTNRASVDIENENPVWLLHRLKIQTRAKISLSPYLKSKLSERPKLLNTKLSLQTTSENIEDILKLFALKLSLSAELDEFLPVLPIEKISSKNFEDSCDYVFFYPFEFERLIAFRVLLEAAARIQEGFKKPVMEYLWQLTASDELIKTCSASYDETCFFTKYRQTLIELIEIHEKNRTNITPEFARMFMRLRKMLNLEIPEIYKNYLDFPEDWFLPEALKLKSENNK